MGGETVISLFRATPKNAVYNLFIPFDIKRTKKIVQASWERKQCEWYLILGLYVHWWWMQKGSICLVIQKHLEPFCFHPTKCTLMINIVMKLVLLFFSEFIKCPPKVSIYRQVRTMHGGTNKINTKMINEGK